MEGRKRAAIGRLAGLVLPLAFLAAPWLAPGPALAEDPALVETPATLVFSTDVLNGTMARLAARDPVLTPALRALIRDADAAMAAPAESVVLKPGPPPGGDLHDYWSLDPAFADTTDPCADTYDRLRMRRMADHALTLALAWRLTGETDYAGKGTALLWAWCCDSLTRARPNLDHGRTRPEGGQGSPTGIIETRDMIAAAEAACMLATSPAWSAAVDRAVRGWFTEYLHWLRHSEPGRLAAADRGSLGLWHTAQVAAFARFTGDDDLARATAESLRQRMAAQPRTGTELRAMLILAAVAEGAGVDLWHATGLRGGLDALAAGPRDTAPADADCADRLRPPDDTPLFHRAALVYKEPAYCDLAGPTADHARARLAH
ncbi:alginate lyase family protein [Pseudodesulfovibrio pelocollis]|uniref:alginate lyase family protein n=1 Tax=Pseudodesulfovibrio pelocollis TaxID=3051432 RepID=UPI00255A75D8|nr:alginate lyase family protein [Pseudodesulfovibrio sp. SB368]